MNLTRFAETPLEKVYESIGREAHRLGAAVADGELIGFIPRQAFQMWPDFFRRASNFDPSHIIERRIEQLLHST